jgi:hypothetical protein
VVYVSGIDEYDLDGSLVRRIPIPDAVPWSRHFTALPSDRFALMRNDLDSTYFIDDAGNRLGGPLPRRTRLSRGFGTHRAVSENRLTKLALGRRRNQLRCRASIAGGERSSYPLQAISVAFQPRSCLCDSSTSIPLERCWGSNMR